MTAYPSNINMLNASMLSVRGEIIYILKNDDNFLIKHVK